MNGFVERRKTPRTRPAWDREDEDESLTRAIDEPVDLSDHDADWHGAFEVERARLMTALPGVFVDVAHIGSTPVASLQAKPVIDLLAGVRSREVAFGLHDALCANGYTTSRDFNRSLHDRQFFMRHAAGRRTHHLHVVVHDSPAWHDRVDFSRLLRDDAALRERYQELKMALVAQHADDREAYTQGKSAFIREALRARDTTKGSR